MVWWDCWWLQELRRVGRQLWVAFWFDPHHFGIDDGDGVLVLHGLV